MAGEAEGGDEYIRGWLDLNMVTGRYTSLLVQELVHCLERRTTNIFAIFDELGRLEGAPNARATRTKPAEQFRGTLLAGLWHKHYFQARSIPQNVSLHWGKKGLAELVGQVMADEATPYEHKAAKLAHTYVMDGYWTRSQSGKITGEWIVYARQDDANYYLTLGTHAEPDEAILDRVKACCDEFPELEIYRHR